MAGKSDPMPVNLGRWALDDTRRFLRGLAKPGASRTIKAMRTRPVTDPETVSLAPVIARRALFVHIPKCAGITVNKTLYGCRGGAHMSTELYKHYLTRREFETFFKFTFVRNPWDRVVSAYHFLREGGLNDRDRGDAERSVLAFATFDEFVREFIGQNRLMETVHFRPQYLFLCKNDRAAPDVDFIGRFERFEEDFATVCARLGVSCTPAHANSGRSRPISWRNVYTDETAEIVSLAYARDITLFDYAF